MAKLLNRRWNLRHNKHHLMSNLIPFLMRSAARLRGTRTLLTPRLRCG